MRLPLPIRLRATSRVIGVPGFAAMAALSIAWGLIPPVPGDAQTGTAMPLDRVVAVVNRQVILSSDIDDDIQLSVLDPAPGTHVAMSRHRALDELISRALIQQQIRREDLPVIQPTDAEVAARVEEIRRQLPACVRAHCETDAGWKDFLAAQGLTQYRVEAYLRTRIQILRFIEERFRQGIQISEGQIETYYRDTLLPQYPAGVSAPPLKQVSSRIEEILLEQQVNELFDSWLDNLRSQGDVEILDPALQEAEAAPGQGDGSE